MARRWRTAVVLVSALVLVLTGSAWGLFRDVTAGITTTDVIVGGGGAAQNILLVGIDSRTDAQGRALPPEILRELHSGSDDVLNADAIVLLHLPEGGGAGTAFSIPRDSYVPVVGWGMDKINAAYPGTKARVADQLAADGVTDPAAIETESGRQGRTALIRTVETLTGVRINHYAEVNLIGFYNLTRAIGGVEVCLNSAVAEPLSGAYLPAGRQTISGADALAFVRQRHGLPEGDLSRIRRQQVFLAAVAHKILASGALRNPQTLRQLVGAAQQSLVIDGGWNILEFAQQAAGVAAGNLEFATIPTQGGESTSSGDALQVDNAQVREFVEGRIAAVDENPGTPGEQDPAPLPSAAASGNDAGPRATSAGAAAPTSTSRESDTPISAGAVPCID